MYIVMRVKFDEKENICIRIYHKEIVLKITVKIRNTFHYQPSPDVCTHLKKQQKEVLPI